MPIRSYVDVSQDRRLSQLNSPQESEGRWFVVMDASSASLLDSSHEQSSIDLVYGMKIEFC